MRNKNAGKGKVHSRLSEAARKKKQAYDKKLNAKPEQIRKRTEANRARRKAKAAGKDVKGKDFDHAVGKFVKTATNRGRRGEGGRVRKS